MPRKKRRKTHSDDTAVRRVYVEAVRLEELLSLDLQDLLGAMPPPTGWRKKNRPGRPRKKRKGAQEEFPWKSMVILLLTARYEMSYREISAHVHANQGLQGRLRIPRARSHATIQEACARIPNARR